MSLRVLNPGQMSLIVDRGRPRTRSLGVPVGGAADHLSFALGNALVGNPADAAALEVCLVGPTLQAGCSLACVLYGAEFELRRNDTALTVGKTFVVNSGDTLEIGACLKGMRAYLCIQGGIESERILNSRSAPEPIHKDQRLVCRPGSIGGRFIDLKRDWEAKPPSDGTKILRVLPGPQASWFPEDALFLSAHEPQVFRVSPAANRMGLRLDGQALPWPGREMISEPVCPGTVQVTREGQCIVLGVDAQTIGGYPKIAQVISADIDQLGQLRPGDNLTFQTVTLETAEGLWQRKRQVIAEWVRRLT